jgi:outer membrane lipoprotein-sorting protein
MRSSADSNTGRVADTPGRPTRLRWLVPPALAAVLVGAMSIVPTLADAEAPPPSLPPVSPQELLLKVKDASVAGLSGTLTLKTDLGLPDLGQGLPIGQGLVPSLLSGDHTAKVWVAGDNVRVAFPTQMAESDIVHNGNDVWVWESDSQHATHLTLPQHTGDSDHPDAEAHDAGAVEPTPEAMADKLLAAVDPTTRVFVRDTATVAGRSAYELVLAPRSDATLVADVVIAVDAQTGLPLRVQVLTKDSGTPALELGFTSIDFSVPDDSTFAFTPPAGAQVTEAHSPEELLLPQGGRSPDGGDGEHRRGRKARADATAPGTLPVPTPPTAQHDETTVEPRVQTTGDGWDTIVIVNPGPATTGAGDPTLDMVKKLAQPVAGGRLLHTSLLNVLFLDDGRVLLGSVNEAALEAAA